MDTRWSRTQGHQEDKVVEYTRSSRARSHREHKVIVRI